MIYRLYPVHLRQEFYANRTSNFGGFIMICIPKNKLIGFCVNLLTKKGVPENNARYIAQMAVDTEASGISTHGLSVIVYLESMIPDEINPTTEPMIIKEKSSTVLIDACDGFSQLAMKLATEQGIAKARKNGIAMIAIRNSFWLGALGIYLLPIAKQGFFAQMWAQSSQCKDCAPFGGIDATFSTNPFAIAFPTHEEPVVADVSTATISMGKLNQLIKTGAKANDKIFMDTKGNFTDDPRAVKNGGSILFIGGANYGYKGYTLSLWCEALTAMAGGSCNNPDKPQRQTLNLTVIDPQAFEGMDYYTKEMKRFIARVKDSRPRPGYKAIRLPGEGSLGKRCESNQKGVSISNTMLENLNNIAGKIGIPKF